MPRLDLDPQVKAGIRLAQEIVRTMYEADMEPGDKYLSEVEAIEKHGVARNTLREALRFLESQGVIRVKAGPGGGPVVHKPGWRNLASTLALLLQFAKAPFECVLEARSVIDPCLAELAAVHATAEELAELRGILADMSQKIAVYSQFHQAYLRFWRRLAESTHNPILAFLSPALRAIVETAGFVPNEVYRTELIKMLEAIHGHIAARDPAAARAAMVALEADLYNRFTVGYPRHMKRVVAWSDLDLAGDRPANR